MFWMLVAVGAAAMSGACFGALIVSLCVAAKRGQEER